MKRLSIALLMVVSIATAFSQNITNAEYFFDADPGPGNGKPISVGSPAALVSFTASVPINNLSRGFHWLGVRTRDSDGKWGLFDRRDFYIGQTTGDMPIITAGEYFYDHDPGVGNATPYFILNPGFAISKIFDIPVPAGMSSGTHWLTIRMKDQTGHWGLFQRDSIMIGGTSTISCPGNVTVNPYTNDCKAAVFSIDAVGLPSNDSSYTYTLTGATTGNGIGTASGKLFNAGVTTVKYALISSPTVSCSFTVTVNPSVTPTVAISVSNTPICEGTVKSFSSIYTNAGSSTTIWQWKKNGINVGANSAVYRDSTLQNSDTITLAMTSAISCAVPKTVTSAPVIMTVYPRVIPSVRITASATSICPGQAVTFTATPTNGGTQPLYQWVKNGVYADLGVTYTTSALSNGDSVYVILYNTTDCIPDYDITSNVIHITTSQTVTPSVSISQSPTLLCSGTVVTFTANPVNGGSTPTYQWKVNDINVGSNSNTYTPSTPVNGNTVKVIMTSSLGCASPASATSNSITMFVDDSLQEFVSITASATTICPGTSVTFSAAESGSGSGTFQWKLNGNNVGTNSLFYRTDSLHNGDKVKVVFSPTFACSPPAVPSNEITITVNSASTPSVSILPSASNICPGQQVTFTATPVNGGATPSYQWKLNGNNVGSNSPTYQNTTLQNGDSIKVIMTSSLASVCQPTVSSNSIIMSVGSGVTPSVSIESDNTTICSGTRVTFTATPVNGGNTPQYKWLLNGNDVQVNGNTYQSTTLANGDSVQVIMTSSLNCATVGTALSNTIKMAVTQLITYYADKDQDGYGDATDSVVACGLRAGFVTNKNDCNDNNPSVHPGAAEICGNGIDDNCNGLIDENCTQNLPTLITRTYPIKEGDAGLTTLTVDVTLDKAAVLPVSIKYKTINEDAIAGTDYEFVTGTLLIPPGSLTRSFQVKIIGDLLRESNERFKINFSDPVNVLLPADPNSSVMIIDDDKGNPHGTANNKEVVIESIPFKIPTVTRRNQVWMIPQISNYENEVLIMNVQGQIMNRFINYKNQTPVGNLANGLYFYRVRITEGNGQYKYYSGKLLITE